MALLWIDGFDHYTTTSGADFSTVTVGEYTNIVSGSNRNIDIATMPELGGFGVFCDNVASDDRGSFTRAISSKSSGTIGVGGHIYIDDDRTGIGLFAFQSGTTVLFNAHVNASGNIEICSGAETVLETSASTLALDTLYHIEMQIVLDNSGSIEVRVNGETWVTATGVDTNNTGINAIGCIGSFDIGSGPVYLDNFYIYDETGTVNNDWLGERQVYTLMPDGDSADTDWTPSTGSDGYAMLDEIPADGDTTYVESTSVGDTSNFTLEDLPNTSIAVIGIRTVIQSEKTGTSTATLSFGPQGDLSDPVAQTQSQYLYFSAISEINPGTSLPWTPGEVNSLILELERIE